MDKITTPGVDPAKSGFRSHGVDAGLRTRLRRQLRRSRMLEVCRRLPPV
jgi:hypothetical protein